MVFKLRETRRAFGLGEFAEMFAISKDTAKRAATKGTLRTIMVGGRRLVPSAEVDRIEKEGMALSQKTKVGR
jgi:excisionase family DNA binding protein